MAARAFAAGETVLADDARRPLLLAPLLRPSHPAFKPLDEYFKQTGVPASVVLKLAAFLCAGPGAAEMLAALPAPSVAVDGEGDGGGPVHEQARAFTAKLRASPPPMLPPGTVEGWPPPSVSDDHDLDAAWRDLWTADEARTARGWVLWSLGGRPTPAGAPLAGSALRCGPAALEHACRGANTAYVPDSGGGGSSTGGARHVALRPIPQGEPLTTCLLGTGRDALLATQQERRERLRDDFFRAVPADAGRGCGCVSCDADGGATAPDASRGVPCPECSTPLRAPDRLLTPEAAAAIGGEEGGGCIFRRGGGGGKGGWTCDRCPEKHAFPDNTAEVWGRHYARSHATIERDMISLAKRVDASLDEHGALSRDVRELASRVDGVARLLGPRHAAVWRLRLAQAECHAGEAERLLAGVGPTPTGAGRMAAALSEVGEALGCLDRVWSAVCAAPFEEEGIVVFSSSAQGDAAAATSEQVAAHALAHHAAEVCSLAREACALAAASPSEGDATSEARHELSERAQTWLARVEGPMQAARRMAGREEGQEGAQAPSDAERESARVREIVGQLQRLAAREGV